MEKIENSAFPYEQIKVWDQEGTGFIDFNAQEANLPNLGYIIREEKFKNLIGEFQKNNIESFWEAHFIKIDHSSVQLSAKQVNKLFKPK